MKRLMMLAALTAMATLPACENGGDPAPPSGKYRIDPAGITVSGISSGGYMATQLQVAHSHTYAGAGVLAAGPYYCAEGSLTTALGTCINPPEPPDPEVGITEVHDSAAAGHIDDPAGLSGDRVWLFHGAADAVVARAAVDSLATFYRAFLPEQNIAFVNDIDAAHLMPTDASGGACTETAAPYIGQCGYDAAGELLEHLYGALAPPAGGGGELVSFDQRPAVEDSGSRGLADSGFLFVPLSCAAGASCRLHVALHGCEMGSDTIGDAFARDGGYNRWAAANDIVVVYPQIKKSRLPLNPAGCWDWWGYDGENYATREGRQVRALHHIVMSLIAN